MSELRNEYESLIEKEDQLLKRIRTCEAYLSALVDYTYQRASEIHLLTAEDIVGKVHSYCVDLRIELVHVKLEKSYIAGQLK